MSKNKNPLEMVNILTPTPKWKEILVKICNCGVCRTDLNIIEGRILPSQFPIVLGHQIVGRVVEMGEEAKKFKIGDRIGIAWIKSSCGKCKFCLSGNEILCNDFKTTGRDVNGGYAEYTIVSEDFAYKIHEIYSDEEQLLFSVQML